LSIGVFTSAYGLPYALSLVLVIYIHEGGHWLWMKVLGLKPKAPMFVPGLGAFVAMTKLPPSEALHAWVALAGPLIGGVGCAALYSIGVHTNNAWLMASGNTGFWINLLQLIPAKPFDGGFVVQAISKWILIPGTIGLFAMGAVLQSPLLLLIAIISFLSWGRRYNVPPTRQELKLPDVGTGLETAEKPSAESASKASEINLPPVPAKTWERFAIAFAYMSLVVALGFGLVMSLNEVNGLEP